MGTNTNERNALIEVETITPVIDTDGYPKTHLYYDSRDGDKFYRGMEPVEVGTEQIEGEDGDFVTVPVHEDRPILVAVIEESNIVGVVEL
ncbi:hypothetical protein E2P86_08665 [Sphingobacterium psychroaquaticum]|uniref:hypothetical protein n=1 Tax=Sphingobacterium psychroaquaticum TaxID=561061 RepID=UPI00106C2421|nr:hypothetical protein [Sphingobacterium psychroaquaticum]QBQ41225.1 hypothetical protein E2P86_08665 [Sphingobacterium psychroaquaticum]